MTNITFDGYNLQDANFISSSIDHENAPEQILENYKIARGDGAKLVDVTIGPKIIKIEGILTAVNQSTLEQKIDEFKEKIGHKEKYLVIDYAGATRKYLCTAKNHTVIRTAGEVTRAVYSIEFEASDPFGYAPSSTTQEYNGITTSPYNNTISVIGSADPEPIYTIIINSCTDLTSIALYTDADGDTITITSTFVASDVLIIDCKNRTLTKNGSAIDYTGTFPMLKPSSNNFTLTTTATARNVDLDIEYIARYR